MNSTANGSSESSSGFTQLNSTAWKIGGTFTYCLFIIVSLAANSLIVTIVYKTPNLRKPINYFIANMASSDLLLPIFWIPWKLSQLHTNYSFLIGGQLGQEFCKLVPFFANVSIAVSIQNLILIAVDRFGAVVFPLRSPLIRSKLCPFFILSTWIVAVAFSSPYLFTYKLFEYSEGAWCVLEWKKVFVIPCQLPTSFLHSVYIHPCAVASHSLLHYCYQAQDTGTPRWTVRQQSATAGQKKPKRASNVHCYRNSVCALLVTRLYQLFNPMVSGQFHAFIV